MSQKDLKVSDNEHKSDSSSNSMDIMRLKAELSILRANLNKIENENNELKKEKSKFYQEKYEAETEYKRKLNIYQKDQIIRGNLNKFLEPVAKYNNASKYNSGLENETNDMQYNNQPLSNRYNPMIDPDISKKSNYNYLVQPTENQLKCEINRPLNSKYTHNGLENAPNNIQYNIKQPLNSKFNIIEDENNYTKQPLDSKYNIKQPLNGKIL